MTSRLVPEPFNQVISNGAVGVWHCFHYLSYKRGEAQERNGKDDGNHAGSDKLNRKNALDTTVAGVAAHAFRIIHGDNTLGFIYFYEYVKHGKAKETHSQHYPERCWVDW